MNRDLSDLPGEGEQRDPVADFFARERDDIRELPAGTDRWESIVSEASRPRRRHALPYLAGAAAAVLIGGVVWGTSTLPSTDLASDATSNTSAVVPTVTVTKTMGSTVMSPAPTAGGSSAPTTPTAAKVLPTPATFDIVSMTQADGSHLYALGAAKCGGAACTAVIVSADNGDTWTTRSSFTELTTPGPRSTPDKANQLVGIRFATKDVGYLYGSATLRTVDGGRSWKPVDVDGRTVLSLETDGTTVWMVTATSCQHGEGTAPQGCLDLQVRSGAVTEGTTRAVTVPPTPSAVDNAWITMDGSDAYLNRAASAPMTPSAPIRLSGKPGVSSVPPGCADNGMWVTGTANAAGTLVGVCPSASNPTAEYSIAVSTNRGVSWTTRPAPALGLPRGTGIWLTATDANHLVAIRQGIPSSGRQDESATVLTSSDGGQGWTPVKVGGDTPLAWAGAAGGGLVYGVGGGLSYWRSDDSGATFESVPLRR